MNCGTSAGTLWVGLRKQKDKPGLQGLVSSAEPADSWRDGEKTYSPSRDWRDMMSFLLTLHGSRHHLLTDLWHSANQLHRSLTYDDLTFENEFLTLI